MPGDSKQRQSSPDEDNENNQPNTTEQSSDDDSKKNLKKPDEKKHNSGAADLEKVTDFAEEKEINSSSTELTDAIANIRKLSHRKMYLVLVKFNELFTHLSHAFLRFHYFIRNQTSSSNGRKIGSRKRIGKSIN